MVFSGSISLDGGGFSSIRRSFSAKNLASNLRMPKYIPNDNMHMHTHVFKTARCDSINVLIPCAPSSGYAGLWVEVDMMITQTVGVTIQLEDSNTRLAAGNTVRARMALHVNAHLHKKHRICVSTEPLVSLPPVLLLSAAAAATTLCSHLCVYAWLCWRMWLWLWLRPCGCWCQLLRCRRTNREQ